MFGSRPEALTVIVSPHEAVAGDRVMLSAAKVELPVTKKRNAIIKGANRSRDFFIVLIVIQPLE